MAYLANPNFGYVPGAPQALNWWEGPQFRMSGVLAPQPALPVAPPAPPLAATPTMQDAAVRPAAAALTGAGGAEPGGGGPGGGPGGIGPGAYPGQPNPGMGGGVGAPGGDQTFSGYPGVYAQAPGELNSQFGNVLGTAGMGVPYPGAGTALGALGGFIDASRYNGINAQYGVPGTVNPWGSAAHEILSGIGVPFTDWDLATLFDVPSARARHLGLLDDYGVPLDRESIGYGALAANEPHTPGAPFGNTGWTPDMNPTTSQYPSGYFPNEAALTIAANPEVFGSQPVTASPLARDVERTIAANPEIFGTNVRDASREPGGSNYGGGGLSPELAGLIDKQAAQIIGANPDIFGSGEGGTGSKGDIALGGDVSGTSGVADGSGYKFRGGLIGAPPGQAGDDITRGQFGLLRGIDPPGPDDQIAAVQSGEGVLTAKTMARYPGLLNAANAGKINPKKLAGLLAAVPVKARRR